MTGCLVTDMAFLASTNQNDYSIGQIADLLCSTHAFDGMPREQALSVAAMMTMRSYARGDCLVRQGDPSTGMLVLVADGEVKISSRFKGEARNLVYRRATPGHLLGEVSFIDCAPHSATCTALTNLDVAVLAREDMAVLMQERPLAAAQLLAGMLRLMAQRLRNANDNLIALTQSSRSLLDRAASQMADTRPSELEPPER